MRREKGCFCHSVNPGGLALSREMGWESKKALYCEAGAQFKGGAGLKKGKAFQKEPSPFSRKERESALYSSLPGLWCSGLAISPFSLYSSNSTNGASRGIFPHLSFAGSSWPLPLLALARGHQGSGPPSLPQHPPALLKASIPLRHLFFALGISNSFSYHCS